MQEVEQKLALKESHYGKMIEQLSAELAAVRSDFETTTKQKGREMEEVLGKVWQREKELATMKEELATMKEELATMKEELAVVDKSKQDIEAAAQQKTF